jgi:predicted acyltransferase
MTATERLISLDAFRGFTVAGMILVNSPGSWTWVYPQLLHAEWNGWTFTDWIFPFFLYIVGVSMTYSMARRLERGDSRVLLFRQVARRAAIIIALGLALNIVPRFDFANLRIPGVLQRIGVCYALSALIMLNFKPRAQAVWIAALLAGYAAAMHLIPTPGFGAGAMEPGKNLAAYIDSLLLSGHMWSQTKTWDPEGVLSTIPAIATTLFGSLTGYLLLSEKTRPEKAAWILFSGTTCLIVGGVWDWFMPINKSLWTSSFAVFMAGWAMLIFGSFYWLIDGLGWQKWSKFFVIYGVNALASYVLSVFVMKMIIFIKVNPDGVKEIALKTYLYQSLFTPVFPNPYHASLAFAVAYNLVFWTIAFALYKRKIFIKI